jgi:hypothetical protein
MSLSLFAYVAAVQMSLVAESLPTLHAVYEVRTATKANDRFEVLRTANTVYWKTGVIAGSVTQLEDGTWEQTWYDRVEQLRATDPIRKRYPQFNQHEWLWLTMGLTLPPSTAMTACASEYGDCLTITFDDQSQVDFLPGLNLVQQLRQQDTHAQIRLLLLASMSPSEARKLISKFSFTEFSKVDFADVTSAEEASNLQRLRKNAVTTNSNMTGQWATNSAASRAK